MLSWKFGVWRFALIVIFPFLIWCGDFERALSTQAAASRLQGYGSWAWIVGIVSLMSDLVLPIPATAVMGALGFI